MFSSYLPDTDDFARARTIADHTGECFSVVVTRLGLMSEVDLSVAFAKHLGLQLLKTADLSRVESLPECLPLPYLRFARAMPILVLKDSLTLAMADPGDDLVARTVEFATGLRVVRAVAQAGDIERALDGLQGEAVSAAEAVDASVLDTGQEDAERLRDLASAAPVIRLVNRWITGAAEAGASDIHIEPADDRLWVRWRVDGVLLDQDSQPMHLHPAVVSRIKIMARLDIGERRRPHDGRLGLPVRGQEVDIRVSVLPTVRGESIVLRILDRSGVVLDFGALGFDGAALERFRSVLTRPNGIVLVTGPTGGGKTTTLYTALKMLQRPEVKILTVEDPVEYRFDRITQVQVHPQIGLDFAEVLRSFLRHDPNVMMVGEIRDIEAARAAMQLSLTGRLVLSTLHTNDSAGAVTRLIDMGVEDYLITATVNGIVAQRLVRRLCPYCREAYAPTADVATRLQLACVGGGPDSILYKPKGCDACHGRGFRGRVGIYEVLIMTEKLREMVMKGASASALRDTAIEDGMEPMYLNGARKALEGITTIEEVISVTLAS